MEVRGWRPREKLKVEDPPFFWKTQRSKVKGEREKQGR
jgi:hypothetical protein